jgi:translocation and assembly module TamB
VPRAPKRKRALWKRIALWTLGSLAALIVLIFVSAYILLHNARFHAYLLHTSEAKATRALGSQVDIGDFSLTLSGLSPGIAIHNLVVHGAAPYPNPPLLTTDLLSLQITVSSLLHLRWYVNDVQIHHPVVRVFADSQGHNNLPHPPSKKSSSGSSVNVFALGIRHLLLDQGQVYYNNQESQLTADLHDLEFHLGFAAAHSKYSGNLSYRNGKVQWQGSSPLPHQLDAKFSATPQQFTLDSAVLNMGRSYVTLQATAQDYSQPKIRATYTAVVDGDEFQHVMKNQSIPAGRIYLSGTANYQNQPGRELLASTSLNGELHAAELDLTQEQRNLSIRGLRANYELSDGNARVTGVHAELLGGNLDGSIMVHDLTGNTHSHLQASLKNISVSAIQQIAVPATSQRAAMKGTVDVTANANWGKNFDDLVANGAVNIAAQMQPSNGETSTPVNGNIHARYNAANEQLDFGQSFLKTPQTTISLNGTVSKRSTLHVSVDARQLHEIDELASTFRAPGSTPLGLQGKANVTATVTGSTRNPQAQGQLTAADLQLHGTAWKSAKASFAAGPSSVRVTNGELVPASNGRIAFQFATALNRWAFTSSSNFQAQLSASELKAHELAKAAGIDMQISGTLSANVQANGTELSPQGQGRVQLTNASIAEEPIKDVSLNFQANGQTVDANLQASLAAGSAKARVQYQPKTQAYQANLQAVGIKLDQLESLKARNLQLTGVLNLIAQGQGTVKDPGLQAKLEIPQLNIRNQTINDINLTASVANHVATFELGSQVLQTHASGHGTVQLTGDYQADVKFDTQALPLQPVIAMYAPTQAGNVTGQTELHATLHGPLKNKSQLNAHVVIPQLGLNYKDTIRIAAAQPIEADYANGALDVKRSQIRGTDTDLSFQAHVPAAKNAPVSILLKGSIDLQLAQLFSPDISSGGQLRFDIDSFGQRSDPNIEGEVRIVNASFARTGTPIGLRDGNGVLTLTRNRLDVREFQGKVGGGTVSASGGVVYRPSIRFDVGLKMDKARILYAQSIRTTISSNLALSGDYDNALLRGQVNIEQLSFTSNFDLMETTSQLGGGPATPPPTGGFQDNLRLQVAIKTPGGIHPSSRKLTLAGNADLQLRGTAAQPVMLGRINLSEGELIFRGNRYLVQGGTVEFRNPSQTEPIVDVAANTTIDQYNIQMRFWGPTDHLHTNYSSDPALPPADIINLIAFGKTSEAAAANPTPSSLGAESLVASQVSGQVTNRIEKLAGISQLSIDPVLGSSQQSPGARIAIQQHVTSKIFVTYATDLTSTQQQAIKVEYQFNRKAALNVVRDQNGGFSFETSFRKNW